MQDFPRVRSQRSAARRKKTSPKVCAAAGRPRLSFSSRRACVWCIGLSGCHVTSGMSVRIPPFCLALLKTASFLALMKVPLYFAKWCCCGNFGECWCGISCQLLEFTEVCNGDYRSSGNHILDCTFSCGPQPTERACAFQKDSV